MHVRSNAFIIAQIYRPLGHDVTMKMTCASGGAILILILKLKIQFNKSFIRQMFNSVSGAISLISNVHFPFIALLHVLSYFLLQM